MDFWNLPESKSIVKLLQIAQRGIKLTGVTLNEVSSLMRSISGSAGFDRITKLLSILRIIASQKEYQILASPIVQNKINDTDSERLNKVYTYMINNFQQDIKLEKVASIASLTTPSFCRYFLNEIRISHACRLLAEDDYPVERICFMCGYSNVSYFIKLFKEITGKTPLNYKKSYPDN